MLSRSGVTLHEERNTICALFKTVKPS